METAETIIYVWEKKAEKHVQVLDMLEDLNRVNEICEKIAKNKFNEKLTDQNRKGTESTL
ncbi:MAG: hypothetical protein GYA51_00885 [Candidatus Methanofastidiosa archaeon]|nr:hypothetical protein [Candidatus Methanofastidiosa archaeon]